MPDVVLHAFNWRYADIASQARNIADAGYGAVLLPPPLYSDEGQAVWWQRYQPKDYRVLRSHLGRKHDLERAVRSLHLAGIKAYADVVFNHMANEKHLRGDPYDFPGAAELDRYRRERGEFERDRLYGDLDTGLFGPTDFNPQGDIALWQGGEQVRERWLCGLPDLDLNDWVVEQQRQCLRALNDLGLDGYRIDAMRHLPVEHIRRVFQTDEMTGKFVVGETLTFDDAEEAPFPWPIVNDTPFMAYDFVLHETLRRAFSPSGSLKELVDPATRGQALAWWQALTFSVTHDIPNNEGVRELLLHPGDEHLANAYVLGRDGGVPMVYSDHNESATAFPEDRGRWADAWQRHDIVQMVRFHNALQGARQRPLFEHDGFIVLARGERGIVAINKTEQPQSPTIETAGLRRGRYRCQLHQQDVWIAQASVTLELPPRQARLWLHVGS